MEDLFNIVRGTHTLKEASRDWPSYIVLTTPTPWAIAKGQLHHPPLAVGLVQSEEVAHYESLLREMPRCDAIVAIGGAAAQDAAKFFSLKRPGMRFHIPTTINNNAALTLFVGTQRQRVRHFIWNVPRPNGVVIDRDLIRRATPRVNRAGISEVLCHYSGLYDWRLATSRGLGPTWDDALARDIKDMADKVGALASEVRRVTDQAIDIMIDVWVRMGYYFEQRRPHNMFGGASEHVFTFNLGRVTGKRLLHAEAVALGCVVMTHVQKNQPERVADAFVTAGTHFKPNDIGVSWGDVAATLDTLKEYASRMRDEVPYSVIDEVDVNYLRVDPLRELVESYPDAVD